MRALACIVGPPALLVTGAFVWLFGSGAVFGQEAGAWPTARAVVQTRVLGDDVVKLTREPEKYVATPGGRRDYLALMRRRGYAFEEQMGSGIGFRARDGRRCHVTVEQLTASLEVYEVRC